MGVASVGERIFFSSRGVACARCHEFQGRGATIGPDLSTIGRSLNRERVIQSIVTPSKEIAPQFTPWVLLLNDGRSVTGTYTGEEDDGTLRIADNQGQIHRIHPRDIEARKPSEESIMPAGLAQQLTAQEWRDLLAFLGVGD
jgi:putative heme-binding domain-containing protein